MEDPPRSSKRRRIDTPKRIASLQEAKPRAPKTPSTRTTGPESQTKPTPAKRVAEREADIYNDIEGALGVESCPHPAHAQLQSASRVKASASSKQPEELQDAPVLVKRGRGRPRQTESASRNAFLAIVEAHEAAPDAETDVQDELSEQAQTSTKLPKTTQTPAKPVRKLAASRSINRKKKEQTPEDSGQVDVPAVTINGTPPKSAKRRQSKARPAVIPETDDELGGPLSASRKQTASARRRLNRTDHINNADDEHLSDLGEQIDKHADDNEDVDGNSIVGSVLDPTEPSPFNKPSSAQKEKPVPNLIYGDFAKGKELNLLKKIIIDRITGKRPSPLVGLNEEYKSVHQVVEHTITAGEGNSMLIIGARGSGKTALVNKVLTEVARDNGGEYHVVRLSGFIHTDDKIALREIWRQLGKEMDIEEDGSGPGKNYADTLATLLALLSHPSEHTGELTDQVAKAVIFVMDEFDLFAQHPRQTLLYNLFDIAQARKAPIAVLGLTTRIDVTNSLEKRVKSRFSHRYVHLSLAKTFTAFQEVCKACLLIQPEDLTVEERGILDAGTKSTVSANKATPAVLSKWNTSITTLFHSPYFLTNHLAPTYYTSKSAPTILTSFLPPIATLSPSTPINPIYSLSSSVSKLALIPHLSTLALSLLIATARLDIIHDSDTANFNMAYDEYVALASRARIQSAAGGISASSSTSKVWSKQVARREWDALVELGLVMPVGNGQVGPFSMVRCDVALEEVGEVLKGVKGEKTLERWCRSL